MDKLVIILFAVFSTSVARVYEDYEDTYVSTASRQTAIDEIEKLEREAHLQYNNFLVNFLAYNETAMVSLAKFNKTYYDDLNNYVTKGEDELIVPGVPVFSECTNIYDELVQAINPVKEPLDYCLSRCPARNAKYLFTVKKSWRYITEDIDSAKKHANDGGKEWKNGVRVETDDIEEINSIISATTSSCQGIRKTINDTLRNPSWAVDSMIKPDIDRCLKTERFSKYLKTLSELIQRIKDCVSSNRKKFRLK